MEDYDHNELAEIRRKLNEIQEEIKQADSYGGEGALSGELDEKVQTLEQKIDELTKRQASSHKVLTVLQQQISGLKVGLNNLEDLLEGEEPERGRTKGRPGPGKNTSLKVFKYITILAFIVLAFIYANRWITNYMDNRWHENGDDSGIYESLEGPEESARTEPVSSYEKGIQTKIDKKLDDIVPDNVQTAEPVVRDEMRRDQPERVTQAPEIVDIFVPRVLILNGCGVSGIAGKLKDYLSRNGIQVVDSKNADNFNYPTTLIYSTSENPDDHIWLDLIGVNPKTVKRLNQERDKANTVIILGKDYQKLSVY
jgi:hypothetical protein